MSMFASIRAAFALLNQKLRRQAILSVLASIVMAMLESLSLVLVYPLVVSLAGGDQKTSAISALFPPFLMSGMESGGTLLLVGIILAALTLKLVLQIVILWWQNGFIQRGAAELSSEVLAVYMRAPLVWLTSKNSSELQRNVYHSSSQIFNNIVLSTLTIITEVATIAGVTLVLVAVDVGILAVALSILVVAGAIYIKVCNPMLVDIGRRHEKRLGEAIKDLNQALAVTKESRVLGRERYFVERYHKSRLDLADVMRRSATFSAIPRLYFEFSLLIVIFSSVIWSIQTHGAQVSIAVLGVFVAAAFRILPSISRILHMVQQMRMGLSALDTIRSSRLLPQIDLGDTGTVAGRFESIEVSGVSVRYPESQAAALDNVSLDINHGDCIGLVGVSGAGKSTLVDVMLGLIPPTSGRVEVDKIDIGGTPTRWHGVAGYVPQTIYLLDDSIRANIALGIRSSKIDDARVWKCLESAQLSSFVQQLPEGLATNVGERGARISGGQRQRIGIARALYHDPQLLVLDEGTSALDNTTEAQLGNTIKALKRNKTILIIAHRLSTVRHCDRIVYMSHGRIVDQGSFQDLAQRQAEFASLVRHGNFDPSQNGMTTEPL
jgi:ABC-type multidrug transport system fused ATPase/permease subunit